MCIRDSIETVALPSGADKSGVTSKSISVPKGAGTIQGMEESFSAQLSTGIATFSVPIALPAARGGAQPSLGLSYSSRGGGGGGRGRRRDPNGPVPGEDLRYDIKISFIEAVHGINRQVEITKKETCWTCEGSGARPGNKPETCPTCHGRGQVIRSQGFFQVSTTCPRCNGAGQVITDPCTDCHGEGLINRSKKVSIRIPAGVDTGSRCGHTIRPPGEADDIAGRVGFGGIHGPSIADRKEG